MSRCHADAANAVTANAGGDGARVFLHPAVDQGNVLLLYFALGKLLSQFAMRLVILGDDNQPASFLVETMDDAGAHLAANTRELREMMQECVNQSAAITGVFGRSGPGMNHHAGRLVDDGEVVVFVDDVEWNLFGDGAQRSTLGRTQDGNAFVAPKLERRFGGSTVQENLFIADQFLHAGSADFET